MFVNVLTATACAGTWLAAIPVLLAAMVWLAKNRRTGTRIETIFRQVGLRGVRRASLAAQEPTTERIWADSEQGIPQQFMLLDPEDPDLAALLLNYILEYHIYARTDWLVPRTPETRAGHEGLSLARQRILREIAEEGVFDALPAVLEHLMDLGALSDGPDAANSSVTAVIDTCRSGLVTSEVVESLLTDQDARQGIKRLDPLTRTAIDEVLRRARIITRLPIEQLEAFELASRPAAQSLPRLRKWAAATSQFLLRVLWAAPLAVLALASHRSGERRQPVLIDATFQLGSSIERLRAQLALVVLRDGGVWPVAESQVWTLVFSDDDAMFAEVASVLAGHSNEVLISAGVQGPGVQKSPSTGDTVLFVRKSFGSARKPDGTMGSKDIYLLVGVGRLVGGRSNHSGQVIEFGFRTGSIECSDLTYNEVRTGFAMEVAQMTTPPRVLLRLLDGYNGNTGQPPRTLQTTPSMVLAFSHVPKVGALPQMIMCPASDGPLRATTWVSRPAALKMTDTGMNDSEAHLAERWGFPPRRGGKTEFMQLRIGTDELMMMPEEYYLLQRQGWSHDGHLPASQSRRMRQPRRASGKRIGDTR